MCHNGGYARCYLSIHSRNSPLARSVVIVQGEWPTVFFMHRRPPGECAHMPHIARQIGRDVAVPRPSTASMKNLSQRPTEASSRPLRPDQGKVGLEVSSIDGVTLSDGEGRGERAQCR